VGHGQKPELRERNRAAGLPEAGGKVRPKRLGQRLDRRAERRNREHQEGQGEDAYHRASVKGDAPAFRSSSGFARGDRADRPISGVRSCISILRRRDRHGGRGSLRPSDCRSTNVLPAVEAPRFPDAPVRFRRGQCSCTAPERSVPAAGRGGSGGADVQGSELKAPRANGLALDCTRTVAAPGSSAEARAALPDALFWRPARDRPWEARPGRCYASIG
jgi:hypothetical protein